MHTSLTEVSTLILTAVSLQYFPLAFWEGYYLSSFLETTFLYLDPTTWDPSALSKRVVFSAITSFWSCWIYFNFFLFSSSSTSLFLYFDFHLFSCFLSHVLHTMGLYYLFQTNQKPLLLLVLLLYFPVLLFKHISIMLGDVRGGGRRHDNVEKKVKLFFSVYILLI